jgi:glycopeptide antibiotics resistance protein
MKLLPKRILLALYLLILLWLVLFKFSFDLLAVLDHQARSLNLIPFAGLSQGARETIDNLIVFIPFGLLLSANFKRITVWRKLMYIFIFSSAVETIQFVFALGVTDITDIITNTLGGLLGLMLYALGARYIDSEKQDRFIVIVGASSLIVLLLLRFLVLKVQY